MTYLRHNPNGAKWSDDANQMLVSLWTEGLSCSQIAGLINTRLGTTFSRNAIIGRAQRMGLGAKAGVIRQAASKPGKLTTFTPPKPKREKPVVAPKPAGRIGIAGNGQTFDRGEDRPPRAEPIGLKLAFKAIEGSQPRPWESRQPGECRWPIDGPNGEFLSCCRKTVDHRYCAEHAATSVRKNASGNPKRKATVKELLRSLRGVAA